MTINILGREFDEEKITPKHKMFDAEHYKDYRQFLLNTPETELTKMPIKHAYERMRFIGQEEQSDYLKSVGYVPPNQRPQKEAPKSSTGKPVRVYKIWNND